MYKPRQRLLPTHQSLPNLASDIRSLWKSLTSIDVIQSLNMNCSVSSAFQEVLGSQSLRSDLDRLELSWESGRGGYEDLQCSKRRPCQ